MAEYLVIRLSEKNDALAHWIVVDDTGARLSPPVAGQLSAASTDIGDRNVIVLVPGVEILTMAVDMPAKSKARIQTALPFALEEFLADDVEDLHFAAGSRRENGQLPVAVVRRDKLQEWIGRLDDAGIVPNSIIAENHGLARIPGTISLLLTGNDVFINDGDNIELVLQDLGPADALAAIGALDNGQTISAGDEDASDSDTPRHVLVYCELGDEEKYSHEWIAIRHEFDSVDIKAMPDGILPRLAVTVGAGAGISLLQGEFGAKTEYAGIFRPWKYAAILLLALTVTMLTAKSIDYYQLQNLESRLQAQFMAEYRQIVPGTSPVRDPVAAVSSLRARTGGSATPEVLLQTLVQLSRALQSNQSANIEAISYRGGVVDIRLSAPSVSVLDQIRQRIGESGSFDAKILSTDQNGEVVNSRIQIQANGV